MDRANGQRYVEALLRDLSEERSLTHLIDQINLRMRLIFDMTGRPAGASRSTAGL